MILSSLIPCNADSSRRQCSAYATQTRLKLPGVTVVGGRSVRRQPQALCPRRVGMRDPFLLLPIVCADVDAHD